MDFIMGDVYNFVGGVYTKLKIFKERMTSYDPIIKLESVHMLGEDITYKYVDKKQWNIVENTYPGEIVYVTWSYEGKQYKYAYLMTNPIMFPPYTVEELRKWKPTKKIIAASSDCEVIGHDYIMKFAGPLHNFYCDKTSKYMKTVWLHESCKEVNIMNEDITYQVLEEDLKR
jgi:hypothetical protein